MTKFTGHAVFITGASSGIGAASRVSSRGAAPMSR
jgi:NADP-dependent 3-hydroxy acid dehydrogenase YdfG